MPRSLTKIQKLVRNGAKRLPVAGSKSTAQNPRESIIWRDFDIWAALRPKTFISPLGPSDQNLPPFGVGIDACSVFKR